MFGWRDLQEFQSMGIVGKLPKRPNKVPTEIPQGMVDNGIILCELFDHRLGEQSFKRNGLSN